MSFYIKKRLIALLCFLLIFISFISCTSKKTKPLLTVKEYQKQSVIIVGAASKLLAESSVKKMHAMTVALQQSRAITCFEVGEECKIYGKIISKMIQMTKDEELTPKEKIELSKDFKALTVALKEGIQLLKKQWTEFEKK